MRCAASARVMTRSITFSAGALRRAAGSPAADGWPGSRPALRRRARARRRGRPKNRERRNDLSGLLASVRGVDSGEGEEVHHLEVAGDPTAPGRRRRPPATLREMRITVELQEPDEDLAHDSSADGPEGQAIRHDVRLLEDGRNTRAGST